MFRPNYVPPLALHAVAVAAAATALQGASSAQLTKGADTNDSRTHECSAEKDEGKCRSWPEM